MTKKVNYFSHDYSARNDTKIISLRRKTWMEWLGIFWALVEMLYENGGELSADDESLENLAYEWRCEVEKIKIVIFDCNLFVVENWKFFSNSINERLQKINAISEKAKKSAEKRWGKNDEKNTNAMRTHKKIDATAQENNANALPTQCETEKIDATAMQIKKEINKKIKKEIEKEKISLSLSFFEKFFDSYPRQANKEKTEDLFCNLSENEMSALRAKMPAWLAYWKTCDLCFVPYPDKFLREKKFLESVPNPQKNLQKSVFLDTPNGGETDDKKREKMQITDARERQKLDSETQRKVTERAQILAYFATLPAERQKAISDKIIIPKIARNGEILLQNGIILALRDEWKNLQKNKNL